MTITHSVNAAAFGYDAVVRDLIEHHRSIDADWVVPTWMIDRSGWEAGIAELQVHRVRTIGLLQPNWFTLADPTRWERERAVLDRTIEAAGALECNFVYGTVGGAGDLLRTEAIERLGDVVAPVMQKADRLGIRLLAETTTPLRFDINFLFNVLDLAEAADATGIGLCIDLTASWAERDIDDLLASLAPRIDLVQLGDVVAGTVASGQRVAPGDGGLPLQRLVDALVRGGYDGLLDVELLGPAIQAEGPAAALRRGHLAVLRMVARSRRGTPTTTAVFGTSERKNR